MKKRHFIVVLVLSLLASAPSFGMVKIKIMDKTPQTEYAASLLSAISGDFNISIKVAGKGPAEGFSLLHKDKKLTIVGNDNAGAIYGANRLIEEWQMDSTLKSLPDFITDQPKMVMRGTCVGLQKTEYLPGHSVYEYPYTPENFPWFYDKELWIRYLDLLASCNMNSVYLWNGHPFASLVKLDDYPFAVEVDDATMAKNEEMFSFLVNEADRRGIRVIQMFYNIILSKPFADHYGLKTQDRNRPITPLISDYTRKSITAFVKKYPRVGFLICLGEAMSGITTDIEWMTETIIPGILDGLRPSPNPSLVGRGEDTSRPLPPIILRSHDTYAPAVLKAALPLYPNIYTMSKYTGESLTTYEPGGPWGETHRELAAAAPVHIDNVHILANLEPWRWSSPTFIRKAVQAMHHVHHSNGLHLYPQASYWDWPYTADRLTSSPQLQTTAPQGQEEHQRLLQIDRDWMWYKAWGRYAWNSNRGTTGISSFFSIARENEYWQRQLANYYGISMEAAAHLLRAYDESGEIAPKLLRRFGITEGNRQTLLLGMKMAQLVNPYKFNVYPGFYESCGPKGEKLIEWAEKAYKHEKHNGEQPLNIVEQCIKHGQKAVEAYEEALKIIGTDTTPRHADELQRLGNDIACYALFAHFFQQKVIAAQQALRYKWEKDIRYLDTSLFFLERSVEHWRQLVKLTQDTYLYANSMQTAQRRIPVGGDNGHFKTWAEMLPVYEEEVAALRQNIERLKNPVAQTDVLILPAKPAMVEIQTPSLTPPLEGRGMAAQNTSETLLPSRGGVRGGGCNFIPLQKGALLFENRADTPVDTIAPELASLQALVLNRDTTRLKGTTIEFEVAEPVQMLVGFFQDDDPKWAKVPKLEEDATGNEYGQAEPLLTNALVIKQMPPVNIHAYHFPAGRHTIRLPRGIIMVAGFTSDEIKPRDASLLGSSDEVDWLFQR